MQKDQFYVLEEWYEQLKQYTSPTTFILLNEAEINFIVALFDSIYDRYFKQLNYMSKKVEQSFIYSKTNWIYENSLYQNQENRHLKQIRDELLKKIKSKLKQNHKYFVKLSLRSPKDSLALRKYKQRLSQKYTQEDYPNISSQLQRLALIIKSADEVLQLLCSSQRIKDDLKRTLTNKNFDVNIIIRQWKTIPSCLEFRVFMKSRKLTAISSYYKSQRHQWLFKYKEIIKNSILVFFEKNIKNLVPYQNGVFDIGFELPQKQYYSHEQIDENLKNANFKITIIEVNPFSKQTGAALFSWQIDKSLLNNGPLEVRLSGEDQYNG